MSDDLRLCVMQGFVLWPSTPLVIVRCGEYAERRLRSCDEFGFRTAHRYVRWTSATTRTNGDEFCFRNFCRLAIFIIQNIRVDFLVVEYFADGVP